MINSLITSQTRIKLLLKFFLNSSTRAHLRGLESEFEDSTNGIRIELNRMEDANLLKSERVGNKKLYFANRKHPLFKEIHNILLKETGIDKVIEKVIDRIGKIQFVFLTGDLAQGKNSPVIDLILVGSDIDREYLSRKVEQAEELSGRKVKYMLLNPEEAEDYLKKLKPTDLLPLWESNEI